MKALLRIALAVVVCGCSFIFSPLAKAQGGATFITAAEAFLDDTGQAPGTGIPLNLLGPTNQSFNQVSADLDLTGVPPGHHAIYLRFQDSTGLWSAPLGQNLYIPEGGGSGANRNHIQAAEAFFDTDPGPGAGIPISTPADGAIDSPLEVLSEMVDLNSSGLSPGPHTVYLRFRDTEGQWSAANGQSVYIGSPPAASHNLIVKALYQIDNQPIRMAPAQDGAFDSVLELVNINEPIDDNPHIGRVWFQDSAGNWSRLEEGAQPPEPPEDRQGPTLSNLRFNDQPLIDGAVLTRPGTVTITATDPASVGRVEFSVDGALFATDSNGSTQYSVFWPIMDVADGAHTLTLTAYDTLSNRTTLNLNVTVALGPPPAPVMLQPTDGLLTNQPQISVAGTAEKGSEVLLYRNGEPIGSPLSLDGNNAFTTTLTLVEGQNNLQAATHNRGGTGPLSAVVRVTLDSHIPPAPSALLADARADRQVRLSWSAVNDTSVNGYDLYRANAPFDAINQAQKINTSRITGTVFDDLPPADGRYYYRVVALTTIGTTSAPSNPASAEADGTAPKASAISYQPQGNHDPVSGRMAPGQVNVTVQVSEPLLTTPFLSMTPQGRAPLAVTLRQTGQTEYQGQFEITPTTPSGTAYAVFSARDRVGNRGTGIDSGGSLLIDTAGPVVTQLTITPPSPIRNDQTNPVTVQVGIELDAPLPTGQVPELNYLLSGTGRQPQSIVLAQSDCLPLDRQLYPAGGCRSEYRRSVAI